MLYKNFENDNSDDESLYHFFLIPFSISCI